MLVLLIYSRCDVNPAVPKFVADPELFGSPGFKLLQKSKISVTITCFTYTHMCQRSVARQSKAFLQRHGLE